MGYWNLPFQVSYYSQVKRSWPDMGNHILASFDPKHIVLYISCPRAIAFTATNYQSFRKKYHFEKMTWALTPSFASIVESSNWGTSPQHDSILALTVPRWAFEELLQMAVQTRNSLALPLVSAQWRSEIDPSGLRLDRSTLTINLRTEMVERFMDEMILKIDDVTYFVKRQRGILWGPNGPFAQLTVPMEKPYYLIHENLRRELQLDRPYEVESGEEKYESFTVLQ